MIGPTTPPQKKKEKEEKTTQPQIDLEAIARIRVATVTMSLAFSGWFGLGEPSHLVSKGPVQFPKSIGTQLQVEQRGAFLKGRLHVSGSMQAPPCHFEIAPSEFWTWEPPPTGWGKFFAS